MTEIDPAENGLGMRFVPTWPEALLTIQFSTQYTTMSGELRTRMRNSRVRVTPNDKRLVIGGHWRQQEALAVAGVHQRAQRSELSATMQVEPLVELDAPAVLSNRLQARRKEIAAYGGYDSGYAAPQLSWYHPSAIFGMATPSAASAASATSTTLSPAPEKAVEPTPCSCAGTGSGPSRRGFVCTIMCTSLNGTGLRTLVSGKFRVGK
jgi:hypothetical protein